MRTGWKSATGLAGWLALTLLAGFFGSRFEPGTWYAELARPAWTPPSWIFGPVWSTLYVLMAIAAWLVWRRDGFSAAGAALSLYIIQLILNGAWSWIFFGLQRPGWAFAEIVVLWAAILATILLFRRQSRPAAWLLAPYVAWVTFAAALNFEIWRLNALN